MGILYGGFKNFQCNQRIGGAVEWSELILWIFALLSFVLTKL